MLEFYFKWLRHSLRNTFFFNCFALSQKMRLVIYFTLFYALIWSYFSLKMTFRPNYDFLRLQFSKYGDILGSF